MYSRLALIFLLLPLKLFALDATSHFQINLLLNKDLEVSRLGAQSVYFSSNPTIDVVDTVAELLLNSSPSADSPLEIDTIAWYSKVVADKNNGRYDDVIAFTRSQSFNKKIIAQLKLNDLHPLQNADTSKYVKGTLSINSTPAYSPESPNTKTSVALGSSLSVLYDKYGAPDTISTAKKNYENSFEKRKLLALNFSSIGNFVVAFSPNGKPQWTVQNFESEEKESSNGYKYQGSLENELHGYVSLLASNDPIESKLGTRSFNQDGNFNTAAMDIVAEQLYYNTVNERTSPYGDTIAWYARALGDTKNNRYYDVLIWASKNYTNNKIKKYIADALKKLSPSSDAYQRGTVDLPALRNELKNYGDARLVKVEQRDYRKLHNSISLHDTYQLLGTPDAIEDFTVHGGTGVGSGNALMLALHYYDYGIIQFSYDGDRKPGWVLKHLMPATSKLSEVYDGPDQNLANTLLSARGSGLWMAMRPVLDTMQADPKMLAVLSKRLLASATTEDDWEVKALAYAAKLLANSKDKTYLPALEQAEQKSKNFDLYEYIEAAANRLRKS